MTRSLWRTALCLGAVAGVLATGADAQERPTTKRVLPGKVTQMLVIAGFGQDCKAATMPEIELTAQPAKGTVLLQSGVPTKVQFSVSGNCVGAAVEGVSILYRAQPDAVGEDAFSIVAKMRTGEAATRTFRVLVTHDVAQVTGPHH